jgi:signal peptidase I
MFTLWVGRAEFGVLATEILESGKSLRFRASGSSMTPFILDGDILEIQPISQQPIRLGDVVLCQTNDRGVVAHRVTRLAQRNGLTRLVTQGDALFYPDGWINAGQVLGRVASVERRGRRIAIAAGWRRWLALIWMQWAFLYKLSYRALRKLYRWFFGSFK